MKITVIIDGKEKEVELSDEQIIAIGHKYFELVSPKIELKPIDEGFGISIEECQEMIRKDVAEHTVLSPAYIKIEKGEKAEKMTDTTLIKEEI